jgi:hypothetical protein
MLFQSAWERMPFDFICTVLRVSGIHYGYWDPLEESYQAFDDYNPILQRAIEEQNEKVSIRIGMLIYCHTVEITAVHELLANLLRCRGGKPFIIAPFKKIHKPRKENFLHSVPPSARAKYAEIKKVADELGDVYLPSIINSFFDDRVRNAFVHADYCLTEDEFRWTEGGPASSVQLNYISEIITRAFAFHEEFFAAYRSWRRGFTNLPRFYKMPQYEVLELLTNDKELYGFKVHFSNGTSARYERYPDQVDAVNISFEKDRTVNFMVGNLDELDPVWKVNGKPVSDWEELNRVPQDSG